MLGVLRTFLGSCSRGALIAIGVGVGVSLIGGLAPVIHARASLASAHSAGAQFDAQREQAFSEQSSALQEIAALAPELEQSEQSLTRADDLHTVVASVVEIAESEGLIVGRVDLSGASASGNAEPFRMEIAGDPGSVGWLLSVLRQRTPFVSVRSVQISGGASPSASLAMEWVGSGELE